jgi:hypothetical protein
LNLSTVAALACIALPAFAQYNGPAILSRGEAPAAMNGPMIEFRPFVEFTGQYDTGLAGIRVNDNGQLATSAAIGERLTFGVSGLHRWKHTKLGLDYRGGVANYHRSTYDSIDQSLLLGFTHQVTRHATLSVREGAGFFRRDLGLAGMPSTVPFDPSQSFIPATDYFDNRTMYHNTNVDFVLQKSARLSFNLGAGLFVTRRRSKALHSSVGNIQQADAQYRLSRSTTVGANYQFMYFGYSGLSGGSYVHGASGTYAVRITRNLEFSGNGGFMRLESEFVRQTAVDPVIAALLGISSSSQIVHTLQYVPNLGGRLSHTFKNGVVYLSGGHTVTPGNGLFATSLASRVMGGYSYTGLRRWSMGVNSDISWATTQGLIEGKYRTQSLTTSLSRRIISSMHFVLGYSLRRYTSPDFPNYNRTAYAATIGIGFSPGEIPLRIW